jgi:RNA polymerase sigma-70 factor, ECF subfamily
MTIPTDDQLLQRMTAGDEEAFAALYRRRQGGIYRFSLHMSGSASIAEDVTQEVFLALIRESRNYNPARGSLSAYLYGVARHHVLRCLEANRVYVPMLEDSVNGASSREPVSGDDPLGEMARNERIDTTRRAVLSLPGSYREVVVLCDLQELSYAEAAAALGCAVGTVRSRLHRGRALLAEKLSARLRVTTQGDLAPAGKQARCFV